MRIAVCVPALNEEKYIHHVLTSVERQTRPPDELVVVAAGTDRTESMCRHWGARVFRQRSRGVAGARKESFAHARAELLGCTDADTHLDRRWAERVEAN